MTNKKIEITLDASQTIENLKEYINDMQTIKDPNTFILGLRMGIVLTELNALQSDLAGLLKELQNENV